MQLDISTPAMLFPAISLLLLAYTNRFLTLATIIRNFAKEKPDDNTMAQIKNLRLFFYASASISRATAIRAKTVSRPRACIDSNRGGPTDLPVTATRTGACALPNFIWCESPMARNVSCSTSTSHSASAKLCALIQESEPLLHSA